MSDIIHWSATETAANIRSRTVSCCEVIQAHLAQIDAHNPALNAVVEPFHEQALALAQQQDQHWQPTGLPALYGVPVTTKINVDQSGSCTSNGVPAFNQVPATQDSPVVAHLKQAGANIIGRTSTPEFSVRWFTSNPIHGLTHNPWHPDITPGGSSGAAAAAVAAGMGCIAHGNDLGGSLRYPAYCCGVATIRPSMGRVATANPSSILERPPITMTMSVQGPIARNVADVRLGLEVMAQRSALDPMWSNAADSGRLHRQPRRIGWCVDAFGDGVEADVADAMQQAVNALTDAGYELIEMPAPRAQEAVDVWGNLLFTETQLLLGEVMQQTGSVEVNRSFNHYADTFAALDLKGFLQTMQQRLSVQRTWSLLFEEVDLFLLPVSAQKPLLNDLDFKQPERIGEILQAQKFLFMVNGLALPSAAVPIAAYGNIPIPVGVQLVGAMHDDSLCLEVAEVLEREIGFVGWLAR